MTRKNRGRLIIFVGVFSIELIFGIYWGCFKGIVLNDSFSRIANSFYVLFIKPSRFASIGLVWNPLPSTLQLPFVAIAKFWRPMVTKGIAASIVTSIFAAFSAILINRAFKEFEINKFYSLVLIVLYITNPFIFFYGFNGMSEGIFFCFIIYIVIAFTMWIDRSTPDYILKIAFALAIAFFCRYEAVPFAMAIGLGVAINILRNENQKEYLPSKNLKEMYYYAEGTFVVLYTPFLYSIILWIFFNWIISGNPLYFLNSNYSNTAQSQYAVDTGTIYLTLKYVLNRSSPFIPVFLGITIIRILDRRLFKNDYLILTLFIFTMITFHFLMLLKGTSFGWLRFFSYSLPICMAWLPYELAKVKKQNENITIFIIAISLVISSISTGKFLSNPKLSPEEHYLVITNASEDVAEYINNNFFDGDKILLDSFLTSGIILNIDRIEDLIVSSSLEFDAAVKNPYKYEIKYIIVPDLEGIGHLDAINLAYPDLYLKGEEWCTEIHEFDGYKLFEVVY